MTKNYQQKVAFSLIELVYVFPPQFRHLDFTYIIVNVGELVFCGHEWWKHCKLSNQYAVPFNKAANNCVMESCGTISCFERNDCECCMPVCRQKNSIVLLWRYKWPEEQFFFLGILCYLSFSVVSDFKYDFLYPYVLMHFIPLVALAWSFLACW